MPRTAWLWPGVPLCCSLVASLLLWCFLAPHRLPRLFFAPHPEGSPDFFNRLSLLSFCALIAGALAVVLCAGGVFYTRRQGYLQQWPLLCASALAFVLAGGTCVMALAYWSQTEHIVFVPPADPPPSRPSERETQMRAAMAVILFPDKNGNHHRPTIGSGVLIGTGDKHTWVLTVPPTTSSSPAARTVWVAFANGQAYEGRVRGTDSAVFNLTLIEVTSDHPPGVAELHPIADAVVPGNDLWFVHNPLHSGWQVEQGTVLKRQRIASATASFGHLDTTLPALPSDVGSGLYDSDGKLVGLVLGGAERGPIKQALDFLAGAEDKEPTIEAITLSSEVIRKMIDSSEAGNFTQLANLPVEVIRR